MPQTQRKQSSTAAPVMVPPPATGKTRRVTVAGPAPSLALIQAAGRTPHNGVSARRESNASKYPDLPKSTTVPEETSNGGPPSSRNRRMTVAGNAPDLSLLSGGRRPSIGDSTPRRDVVGDFLKERGMEKIHLRDLNTFRKLYVSNLDKEIKRERKNSIREQEEEKKMREELGKRAEEDAVTRIHASYTLYANLSPEARRAALSETEEELYGKLKRRFPRLKDVLLAPCTIDRAADLDLESLTVRLVKAKDIINHVLEEPTIREEDALRLIDAYNDIQNE